MNLRRCLSFVVALFVALSVVCLNGVKASAVEGNSGGWIEFLETTSVQTNGENWFTLTGQTGSFTLPLHTEKRLVAVDMLIWHQAAERITNATVTAAGSTYGLSVVFLGNCISRIYGDIPNAYYDAITVSLTHNTTSKVTYELLSFKATPLTKIDYEAQGYLYVDNDYNNKLTLPNNYRIEGDEVNFTSAWITRMEITDWRKYDYITFFGSISGVGLNAVRASVGTKGLPFTITYCQSNPSEVGGSFQGFSSENHYDSSNTSYGKINGDNLQYYNYRGSLLYTITVDLTGLDRTDVNNLMLYFTGVVNSSEGHYFNCQFVTGTVLTADTSSLSWWTRFTTFMEGLFAGDSDTDVMQQVAGQSQDLAEDRLGAVAQAGAVIDGLTGAFQNHGVMDTISFPALTINFGGVPWTFGGWNVSVIPPGFEPLVQTLKLIIDIVATLAFLQAMRSRLERLLVGGNA